MDQALLGRMLRNTTESEEEVDEIESLAFCCCEKSER